MLNHNPILFVLGYILAAVAFLAFIAAITLEAIQSRKRHE